MAACEAETAEVEKEKNKQRSVYDQLAGEPERYRMQLKLMRNANKQFNRVSLAAALGCTVLFFAVCLTCGQYAVVGIPKLATRARAARERAGGITGTHQ